MKNVDYKKLKRYDIGKREFSGYQRGDQIDTSGSSSTPSQSFSGYDSEIRSQIAPSVVTKGISAASTWLPMFTQGWTTAKEAAAAASAAQTAGSTASTAASTGSSAGSAAGSAASTAAKIGLNSLGKITGLVGTIQGGLNIASDVDAFSDPIVNGSDMLNSIGRSTQQKYGQSYTTYTGFDMPGIMSTIEAANSRDVANLTTDTTLTGVTAGTTIGSFFGPIGTAVGGVLGALGGLLGGIFGGKSAAADRRKRAETTMNSLYEATSRYNLQQESEAASKGLSRLYAQSHGYDRGKAKGNNVNYADIGYVYTSDGIRLGYQLGLGGKGETMFNPVTEQASLIKDGKKRVDNISVGVPLQHHNVGKEWGDTVILGNTINKETGNLISEDAEPHTKAIEKLNKENPMTKIGKRTKEINLKNQLAILQHLTDIQEQNLLQDQYKYNCGKSAKYDPGKLNIDPNDLQPSPYVPYPTAKNKQSKWPNLSGFGDYAAVLVPHLAQFGMLLSDNTDYTPRSYNPYVSSNYSKYVDNMRRRRLNPAQAIKNIQNAQLQNRYAVTHQGGLSAGQIAALSSLSNINAANAINNTIFDYNQKNIALANEVDRLGMQAAMSDAARKQQANSYWWENLAKSNSTAYNLKQANKKAKYDQISALSKDILSMIQYNQAKGFKNRILNMYDQALNTYQQDIIGGLG